MSVQITAPKMRTKKALWHPIRAKGDFSILATAFQSIADNVFYRQPLLGIRARIPARSAALALPELTQFPSEQLFIRYALNPGQ